MADVPPGITEEAEEGRREGWNNEGKKEGVGYIQSLILAASVPLAFSSSFSFSFPTLFP